MQLYTAPHQTEGSKALEFALQLRAALAVEKRKQGLGPVLDVDLCKICCLVHSQVFILVWCVCVCRKIINQLFGTDLKFCTNFTQT